jgi:hypothetical protein
MTRAGRSVAGIIAGLALAWARPVAAEVPEGWSLAGESRKEYEAGVDRAAVRDGKPSAFLRSKDGSPGGFGTLMQTVLAENYRRKRLRLAAFVRTENVAGWAGLWMRIDCLAPKESCGFDNMQGRPIKGTVGWTRYEVVLDVPEDATVIAFGVLLGGSGRVLLNQVRLDVVDKSVPTTDITDRPQSKAPRNLDFSE